MSRSAFGRVLTGALGKRPNTAHWVCHPIINTYILPPSNLILTSHMSSPNDVLIDDSILAATQVDRIAVFSVRHLWIVHPPKKYSLNHVWRITNSSSTLTTSPMRSRGKTVRATLSSCLALEAHSAFQGILVPGVNVNFPAIMTGKGAMVVGVRTVRPLVRWPHFDFSLGLGTMWFEPAPHTSSRHRDPGGRLWRSYQECHGNGGRCSGRAEHDRARQCDGVPVSPLS